MSTYLTPAIPLRIVPFTRQDELVTLYTRSHGKVMAIVRGGQKISSKLSQRLHAIQEVEVMLAPGKLYTIVAGIQTRRQYSAFEHDIARRLLVLTLIDMIQTVSVEGEHEPVLYDVVAFWMHVCATISPIHIHGSLGALIAWRLLSHIGLRPEIKKTNAAAVILQAISSAQSETEALAYITDLDIRDQITAGRVALPRIEAVLERELRGLRVYRDVVS